MAAKARGVPLHLVLLAPAVLLGYFAFNAGGFFPRPPAFALIAIAQVLVLYVALSPHPFARLSWPAVTAVVAMCAFAVWVLASQLWSHAPGRSIIEFDRALLYLVVLVLCVLVGGSAERLRFAVRIVAATIIVVAVCALASRLAPDAFPTDTQFQNNRLSFPLTYWNALGVLVGFGSILCLHLTCSREEPYPVRILAAAALPVTVTTLFFTFSRGSIWVSGIGAVLYVLVARPRALLTGVLAVVPTTVIAVVVAYHANLLATTNPTTPAAVHQGHRAAGIIIACIVAAALIRGVGLLLDERRRRTLPEHLPVRARQLLVAACAAGAVAAVVVLFTSGTVTDTWHKFSNPGGGSTTDFRARLTLFSGNGRYQMDRVALHGYRNEPLHGNGAGTYALTWDRYRPFVSNVTDGHSLYFESLSEMGIVGVALILIVVLSIVGTAAARARGPDRAVYGAVFAACLAWALHAGVDWDWEMPATTIPFLALGGLALGSARSHLAVPARPPGDTRLAMCMACVACLVMPVLVIGSQARYSDAEFGFSTGDCRPAINDAANSLKWLAKRSEAYEVMGFCDMYLGFPVPGLQAMNVARRYDPENWELYAGTAIAKAYLGRDPRPDMDRAIAGNPRVGALRDIRRTLGATRGTWIAHARDAQALLYSSGELAIS